MKQFATKAELISEDNNGVKTYQIDWVDRHGVAHSDFAKGSDMKTALSAVLRKKVLKKLSNAPEWIWFAAYTVFMAVYGAAAMSGNRPTLVVLGCFTLLVALRLAADKYFRYVK